MGEASDAAGAGGARGRPTISRSRTTTIDPATGQVLGVQDRGRSLGPVDISPAVSGSVSADSPRGGPQGQFTRSTTPATTLTSDTNVSTPQDQIRPSAPSPAPEQPSGRLRRRSGTLLTPGLANTTRKTLLGN